MTPGLKLPHTVWADLIGQPGTGQAIPKNNTASSVMYTQAEELNPAPITARRQASVLLTD
eukprot:gene13886-14005_t